MDATPRNLALKRQRSLELQRAMRCAYYEGLQAMRSRATDPGSPSVAAVLAMLFAAEQLQAPAQQLRNWLYDYIDPFIGHKLEDESDQIDKVFAASAYLMLTQFPRSNYDLPEKDLIDCIEYAHAQDWFGDPFLAFCCHQLRSQVHAAQHARAYFESNFDRFVERQHLVSVCQSLIVLTESEARVSDERCVKVIAGVAAGERVPLLSLGWALWAASNASAPELYSLAPRLAEKIERGLAECFAGARSEPHRVPSSISDSSGCDQGEAQAFGAPDETDSSPGAQLPQPSALDVGLALLALKTTGNHEIVGVQGDEEAELRRVIGRTMALESGSSALVSHSTVLAYDLLLLVSTILSGAALILASLGGLRVGLFPFLVTVTFENLGHPGIDIYAFVAVWLAILIGEIRALLIGSPAIENVKDVALLRKLVALFETMLGRRRRSL